MAEVNKAPLAVVGDVTNDGEVAKDDVEALLRLVDNPPNANNGRMLFLRADVDFNGVVDKHDCLFIKTFLVERMRDGNFARLLALLLGWISDKRQRLEDFVETCGEASSEERRKLLAFLGDYLSRGGGKRLPAAGEPGSEAIATPQTAAFFIAIGLCELDFFLLQEELALGTMTKVEGTKRVGELRKTIARVLAAAEQEGRAFHKNEVNDYFTRFSAVGSGLAEMAKKLPAPRPVSVKVQIPTPLPTKAPTKKTTPIATKMTAKPTPTVAPKPTETVVLNDDELTLPSYLLPLALLFPVVLALWWFIRQGRQPIEDKAKKHTELFDPLMAGEIALQRKNYGRAVEEFRRIVKENADYATAAQIRLCLALAGQGKKKDVPLELKKVALNKVGYDILFELGCELQRLSLNDEALLVFKTLEKRGKATEEVTKKIRVLSGKLVVDPFDIVDVERYFGNRYFDYRVLTKALNSVVYRVRDRQLQRDVALKVFAPEGPPSFEERDKFELAIERLARLKSDSVARIFDNGLAKLPFYTMEFVEGDPLDLLIGSGALAGDYDRIVKLAILQAQGLRALHEVDVAHGAFRPDHVIVHSEDQLKIIGYGLSNLLGCGKQAPVLHGSPAYMSPEVLQGGEADEKADIYSFGVTCYEMVARMIRSDGAVSGKYPFGRPRAINTVAGDCPPKLAALIMACIDSARAVRPKSFDRIADELQQIKASLKGG